MWNCFAYVVTQLSNNVIRWSLSPTFRRRDQSHCQHQWVPNLTSCVWITLNNPDAWGSYLRGMARELRVLNLLMLSCSVMSTLSNPMGRSLPGSSVHGDSPGKNTGVGCLALLQGIFPSQGLNPGLPHCRQIFYHLSHQGSPKSSLGNPNVKPRLRIIALEALPQPHLLPCYASILSLTWGNHTSSTPLDSFPLTLQWPLSMN